MGVAVTPGSFGLEIPGDLQVQLRGASTAGRTRAPGDDEALTKAAKVVKRTVEATTDEVTGELQEALRG
jgi:hypothetical protein